MSIFKCKMCGGDLEINEQISVCECQYCGSKQTLPKLSDEKKNNLYDRAGHFRRNNEYDKAMAIYEQILNEDAEDAESYWSIVLCHYGIEYVEDPMTHKRMPTVNRAQLNSIFADENYKAALKYADAEQRALYEAEAREIEQIQKGILAISDKEEPFDVFICYKESDANGRRTPDSVLANDLYHQLTQEGFRVFFARITLEDKLGSAYEPYIFAALNSAKVMVVLGTKPEYFNAVWVKNEWSRYLALIRCGAKKILIPAYRDMDPYDLPEEFSHLQAQDMTKLGFMQDLIRGIKKLAGQEQKTENVRNAEAVVVAGNGATGLIERAFLFIEDGEFERADELCEQALNQDPKNANAYVAKLMIERRINRLEGLSEGTEELTENNYFQKALRFAEKGLKNELERCNQLIMDRNKDIAYEETIKMVKENGVEGGIQAAIQVLETAIGRYKDLLGWKDSEAQIEKCNAQKEVLIDRLYQETQELVEQHNGKKVSSQSIVKAMKTAIANLEFLGDYSNSKELLVACQEKKKVHVKKIRKAAGKVFRRVIVVTVAVVIVSVGIVLVPELIREKKYNYAETCFEEGNYEKAKEVFDSLEDFKDSERKSKESSYCIAEAFLEAKNYEKAAQIFEELEEYRDSMSKILEIKGIYIDSAQKLMEEGKYEEALKILEKLGDYEQSLALRDECKKKIDEIAVANEKMYQEAVSNKEERKFKQAVKLFKEIEGYKDSAELALECEQIYAEEQYAKAMLYKEKKEYGMAILIFELIADYDDVAKQLEECERLNAENQYTTALAYMSEKKYEDAILVFEKILEYKNSKEQLEVCNMRIKEETYNEAMTCKNEGKYVEAIAKFNKVKDYENASEQIRECKEMLGKKQPSIAAGDYHTVAIKTDGTVIAAGDNQYGQCNVRDWRDIVTIAAGRKHTVGLKKDGTVIAIGDNEYGQCNVQEWTGVIAIAAGGDYTVGLSEDGHILAAGKYYFGAVASDIIAIDVGDDQIVALRADGTVVANREVVPDITHGWINYGECNVQEWTDIIAIATNDSNTVGLKKDGTLVETRTFNGIAKKRDFSHYANVVAIATFAGDSNVIIGVKDDGTVFVEGADVDVSEWTDIVTVAAGKEHIVGLKKDGTVVAIKESGGGDYAECYSIRNWQNIRAVECN